jgi:phosphoribosylaminoimidazolecarboxamide formyltransferase/IMP cyclohydrolase
VIAPGYEPEALDILQRKRSGKYLILLANPDYVRPETEVRDVFGIRLEQTRDEMRIDSSLLDTDPAAGGLDNRVRRDLLLAAVGCRYYESNAIALVLDGQMIGVGGGQPSRIAATEIACTRGDVWKIRKALPDQHLPLAEGIKLNDVDQATTAYAQQSLRAPGSSFTHGALTEPVPALTAEQVHELLASFGHSSIWSDGFIPFEDNITVAAQHGVGYLGQPGGSVRDPQVAALAKDLGITTLAVGHRFFFH